MDNSIKNNNLMSKSTGSILVLFIITSIAISAIWLILGLLITFVLTKFFNIHTFITSIPFICISTILRVFVYTYVFKKMLQKKYILADGKQAFLHKFVLLIFIFVLLSLVFNTVFGLNEFKTRLTTIEVMNEYAISFLQEEEIVFKDKFQDTYWEDCTSYNEIRVATQKAISDAIFEELAEKNVIVLIEAISSVVFVEIFIKKEM